MAPQDAIDVAREAIVMMLTVSAPVLACGLAVGLLGTGIFQWQRAAVRRGARGAQNGLEH